MKSNQSITRNAQIDYPFMEHWVPQAISVANGLYHLTYDGGWHCIFASDNCLEILNCSRSDFLERLQNTAVLTAPDAPEKTVRMLLREITDTQEPCSFVSVVPQENGKLRYIKGTLAVSRGSDGLLWVYGQIADLSAIQERDVRFHDLEEEYQAGLQMSGRTIYRYLIEGRRAIIPPEAAKRGGIPEVIDNLPEWNVARDRIAPQSVEAWRGIFDAIDRGEKQGAADVVFRLHGGEVLRRCRVEFTSVTNKAGIPISAFVSHRDITDEYERDHLQALDRAGLLQIAQMSFPEILTMNLTKGTYRMIQYYNAATLGTPVEGPLDQMLLPRLDSMAPEDQQSFRERFFREGLLKAIHEGKDRIQITYRQRGKDGVWHWMESIGMRQENPYDDDILMVAVSRNVDNQKEEEDLPRQALADSSAKLEDWLYYNNLSNHSFPGLVYVSYSDGRPSPYVVGRLAEKLECPPKELALSASFRIRAEDKEALRLAREQAERSGAESFQAEYRVDTARGETAWVSNRAIRFVDKDGSAGYIHFLTDTTDEHALSEQLRLHMEERMKESEQIFHIVAQHSNRTLYYYDINTRRTHSWDEGSSESALLAHLHTGSYSDERLADNRGVLPESIPDVKRFFEDIHGGRPSGEANVHVRLLDGQRRWFHFRYSSLFTGSQPTAALLSIEDVTERHEHEMAYRRHVQSLEHNAEGHLMYIESDLTADRIENLAGQLLPVEERNAQCSHSDFGRLMLGLKFQYETPAEASQYFSCENLLELYAQGERQLRSEWQVRFSDGTRHWLDTETVLMADPYNGHVKAFFRMMDITEEHEEHLAVIQRADFDAMTGMLRKDVGEERIKQHLALNRDQGGILIALDLDDLKGLNDTLGHKQGDAAITAISDTLKSHFRRDDILIRAGGDEFIVYLPGAGQSVSSVELSITALLRKLSSIAIGENNERTIHCSVGCAVELPGADTYDSLFKRADTALYHVKRHGKNSFAFFEPEMLQADYEFKLKQAAPIISGAARDELQHLLKVIATHYPGIVLFNLTRNYFRALSIGNNIEMSPASDAIDVFWQNMLKTIHPDDQTSTLTAMSRSGLLSLYAQGQRRIQHYYRSLESVGCVSTEVAVNFYTTDVGDICAFLFFRWDIAPEKELEILRLQKILELSVTTDFEYICLIDVRSKSYSTFSRDGKNTHDIPEIADFDMVTKHIRDTQLRPEDRDAYYKAAALEEILLHMRKPEGRYSYRYTMVDGVTREAVFNWYEDSHSELLMTVRKIVEA